MLASIDEVECSPDELAAAVQEAARRPSPTLIRLGPEHAAVRGFARQALRPYSDVSVVAESGTAEGWHGTFGELLARLDERPPNGLYMKHATLNDISPELLTRVPKALRELNWLSSLPTEMRPFWYWLMVGQVGTSTRLHVDSMASAAWNLLIEGEKRWRFLPPHMSVDLGLLPPSTTTAAELLEIEFDQQPGDIIFTPSGWAHSVDNRTPAVAVTGNYIGEANIDFAIAYFKAVGEADNALLCTDVKRAFTRNGPQ